MSLRLSYQITSTVYVVRKEEGNIFFFYFILNKFPLLAFDDFLNLLVSI